MGLNPTQGRFFLRKRSSCLAIALRGDPSWLFACIGLSSSTTIHVGVRDHGKKSYIRSRIGERRSEASLPNGLNCGSFPLCVCNDQPCTMTMHMCEHQRIHRFKGRFARQKCIAFVLVQNVLVQAKQTPILPLKHLGSGPYSADTQHNTHAF